MTEMADNARDLRSQLDSEGARADLEGTPVTDAAMQLCLDAGFQAALVPKELGGAAMSFSESLDLFAEVSRADGSTGWVVMAAATAVSFFSSYCPDSFTNTLFADGVPLVAGQFAPNGTAAPGAGDFAITGSYSFGSGIQHADWVGCGSLTTPDDGDADYIFALVPRAEVDVTGNWGVMGLRSTASFDYTIDSTVPADRTFSFFGFERNRGPAYFNTGVLCITVLGHAGWILGVLRRAIDEATAIAGSKKRMTGASVLAEDPRFRFDLAEAESRLRSGELWIRAAFAAAERSAGDPGGPDQAAITEAKQATAFLTREATAVVQSLYLHLGTSALRDGAFQRCFRDIHAGSQHAMVSPMQTFEFADRMLSEAGESALEM
jgi:alkylation response protein AidB-like acyl-CoA dehydrogenase